MNEEEKFALVEGYVTINKNRFEELVRNETELILLRSAVSHLGYSTDAERIKEIFSIKERD